MIKKSKLTQPFKYVLLFLCCIAIAVMGSVTVSASEEVSGAITLRFLDSNGRSIAGISDMTVSPGETAVFPNAPVSSLKGAGVPSWKPARTATEDMYFFESGKSYSYAALRDWTEEYGNGDVLTLYGTKICSLYYFDNAGVNKIGTGPTRAYEGTEINLRKSPNTKNELYRGWSRYKNGTGVWGQFGGAYTVTCDLKLYLVEYIKITFRNSDGSTNSTYNAYSRVVKKGSTVTLPNVPSVTNYRNLGWALSKKASSATYSSKQKIQVTGSMTLYAARKYLPHAVTFNNNTGTSKSNDFKKLYVRAAQNESITLPEVPYLKGYVALGWATKTKATAAQYKEGAKVRITKKTKFYAVYRKANTCTVTFCMGDGTIPSAYAGLKKTITEGTSLTLPSIPARSGYKNEGWALKVNGKTTVYQPGTTLKIKGNYKFYAVQKQGVSVVLHKNKGAAYASYTIEKGGSFTLPSAENTYNELKTEGYIFMGWSTKANVVITSTNPQKVTYEAGEVLNSLNSTVHLYQVVFKRSTERSLLSDQIAKLDTDKYRKVILVGDSRTVRMYQTLRTQNCVANLNGVSFVASSGQGLSWLKSSDPSTGYNKLVKEVKAAGADASHPVAIVFNLGINDMDCISQYITYLKQIAPELQAMNCKLFYMSLNPINSVMIDKKGLVHRDEAQVRNFNAQIRSMLGSVYTYIDTYSWLMQTGYSTDSGEYGQNSGIDDGLHYTVNTYKRIFDKCISTVNAN